MRFGDWSSYVGSSDLSATKAGRERPDGGACRPRRPASQRKRPGSGEAHVMQVMAGRTVIVAAATIAMALVALAVINVALADGLVQRDVFAAESVIDAAALDGLRGREGGQRLTEIGRE